MYGGFYTPQPLSPEQVAKSKRNEQGRKAANRAMLELGTLPFDIAMRLPETEIAQMACRHLFTILDEEAAKDV